MPDAKYGKLIGAFSDVFLNFLQLLLSMYVSAWVMNFPLFGGALYVAGRFWVVYAALYSRHTLKALPAFIRAHGAILSVASIILCMALLFVYPWLTTRSGSPMVFLAILLIVLRQIVTDALSVRLRDRTSRSVLILVVVHIAFMLCGLIFFWNAAADAAALFVALSIVGALLLIKQIITAPMITPDTLRAAVPTEVFGQVTSYRIYNRMIINVFMALNLGIAAYICYMPYLPFPGIISSFVGLCVWLAALSLMTGVLVTVLLRRVRHRYDKPTIFVVGAVIWILTTILVIRGSLSVSGYSFYIVTGLYGTGLSCMLALIVAMGTELKSVIEIGVGHIDNGSYEQNSKVMLEWSMLLSLLLLLTLLTIASLIMDGYGPIAMLESRFPRALLSLSLFLPMIFVILALIALAIQPLDREYLHKLWVYRSQLEKGTINKPLEDRLKRVLVASTPKRIGIRLLKQLVRPFVPLRILGRENVRAADMPVIFVCNHYEIYGPIAAVARIPYYLRPWIISTLLDRRIIRQGLRSGIDTVFPRLPARLRALLGAIAAPLILWIVQSLDPIPVYRDNPREVVRTFRLTVEALECDDNILLFPENPTGKYAQRGVSEFFSGFSYIGAAYHQKTGKAVTFIPVYIHKQRHTLTFGDGVRFDPDRQRDEEKERIVTELRAQMLRMGE